MRKALWSIGILVGCILAMGRLGFASEPYGPADAKITIVVMDPMSLPLACDCVQGYAQRKYERLADYLQATLGESVRVVWSESLERGVKEDAKGNVTIVIGKDSVVRAGSQAMQLELQPVAHLTDMNGSTMQHGLFVVRRDDKANTLLDLTGYKIFWGPDACDEKSAAPRAKLEEFDIKSIDGGVCASCSVAAKQLMAESLETKAAAIISSYAEPLLAGCGTIQKGDLRVLGKSEEVPFVSAFVNGKLPREKIDLITKALLEMKSPEMLKALETKNGFLAY